MKGVGETKTTPAMRMGKASDVWVREGQPCVKVRIMQGEATKAQGNKYLPAGEVPDIQNSSPLVDRHIAQQADAILPSLPQIVKSLFELTPSLILRILGHSF